MNSRMVEFNASRPKERRFLGVVDTNGLSSTERNFHKKHLRAYLRGHEYLVPPTTNPFGMIINPGIKVQQYISK